MSTPILGNRFIVEIEDIPSHVIQRLWFTKAIEPHNNGISGGSIRVELYSTKEDGIELIIQELCKKKNIKDISIRILDEYGIVIRTYTLNHASLKNILMPTFDYSSSTPIIWCLNILYKKLIVT
ncbi:MAG: hypothetical protein WC761_01485 [Candidatus Paceibacterota bacterium]|jgi:hypothetical protein